jgi:hypothetical protein
MDRYSCDREVYMSPDPKMGKYVKYIDYLEEVNLLKEKLSDLQWSYECDVDRDRYEDPW